MRVQALARRLAVTALALLGTACGQKAQSVTLRSLEASDALSFACFGFRGNERYARNLEECPDVNPADSEESRHLFSLVAQRNRGEVAVLDLTAAAVVDEEPAVPGSNFLPVGGTPVSIVSTPGSVATFVGVAEPGKEGLFALPSSCVMPRKADEPVRDLTSWSACRLPAAPGDMAVVLDGTAGGCDGQATTGAAQNQRECPAVLSDESEPGRRVLVVSLPDLGGLAVIDAQTLLDRPPGEYKPCDIERWVPLRADPREPGLVEELPPDFTEGDRVVGLPHAPDPAPTSRPAGFAMLSDATTGEHRLFIADREASLIHDVDTSDVCAMEDTKPPLRPLSFLDPNRFVTTKRVAVSPLTTQGYRYLYAIDEYDTGSLMTFDVSPGETKRTPLIRTRSEWTPQEPPDRIKFDAPIQDVTFGLRDRVALNESSGVSQVGILCDPTSNDVSLQGQYWPKPDFSGGAAASNLRGIFAFAALSTGTIAVIDVEDFDYKCRRPAVRHTGSAEDFRGCSGDATEGAFAAPPDPNTRVTNEVSCQVVEPHRPRSATLELNDSDRGVRAPALRARPKLIDRSGRSLSVDVSDEGHKHPHLLGVNFGPEPGAHAQVYVGTTLLETTSKENLLDIDPTTADQASLVLAFSEPRSYVPTNQSAATFEGHIINPRLAARYEYHGNGAELATLTDAASLFCGAGVEDVSAARLRGLSLGLENDADLDTFAVQHADMAVITSELLDEKDAYWTKGRGAACGSDLPGATAQGFTECGAVFGTAGKPTAYRELRIAKATVDTLTVEPRSVPSGTVLSDRLSAFVACCFPEVMAYEVRASNEWVVAPFEHHIVVSPTTADRHCVPGGGKFTSLLSGRVIEVSCDPASSSCAKTVDGERVPTSIGLAQVADPANPRTAASRDVACVIQDPKTDTQTICDPATTDCKKVNGSRFHECIHQGLTTRFVIYRGQVPSQRDMQFIWNVNGSFSPLTIPLATRSDPNSVPQRIVYSNELRQLVVADGSNKGVVLVDLSTFGTAQFF